MRIEAAGGAPRRRPIARVLLGRDLESVNSLGEDREEAVHNLVPFFRIHLLGEVHGPLHVREEDRHLLALPFQSAARRQDLLGEVLRGVGAGIPFACFPGCLICKRRPTLFAEFRAG
jgi:hypothetical protein